MLYKIFNKLTSLFLKEEKNIGPKGVQKEWEGRCVGCIKSKYSINLQEITIRERKYSSSKSEVKEWILE